MARFPDFLPEWDPLWESWNFKINHEKTGPQATGQPSQGPDLVGVDKNVEEMQITNVDPALSQNSFQGLLWDGKPINVLNLK